MTYETNIRGGLTSTHGSCPGCGARVKRVHAWTNGRAREAYDCPNCGEFEYSTNGVEFPDALPASLCFSTQTGLRAVLDPVDCIG
jgi:predicted RNA-binding Zn-ribbon protein involved in translation (DUF1610 family)